MPRADLDSLRCFFLAGPPAGGVARLLPEDEQHALRVLRVAVGDELLGLDGRGGAWRIAVIGAGKRKLELGVVEALPVEPAPGETNAPLPWIEVWAPLPKAGRAEEMVDRLTQLGAARVAALVTERTAPHAREAGANRLEKLRRRAREACKQSGRRWMPELEGPRTLEERLAGRPTGSRLACLDPRSERTLVDFLAGTGPSEPETAKRMTILSLGPEGGWSPDEERALVEAGAARVKLTPFVLRIETAAEAACAIAAVLNQV
ncbi:MAG: 16S rRNA (uracil(1498)-N(3))-methyltransferase [Planctomycetes bacterium]|nr:16S rRNA (uracil(1498)-N(3))-methyltransferase [Planctomycetota bacterium]